ncbi:MAG: hypothetical protein OEN22_03555, partial [Gammaproteobacteria bacterium]|nr:hypothetical protein [Gammaproteobacteria bacterium]
VTTILLPAVCAFWLWLNTDRVLPREMVEEQPSARASEIMLIGVSLLGLYLLVWGVINLVRVEAGMAGVDSIDAHAKISQRIPYMAQIFIAVPLLMGRRRLSELLLNVKLAGTDAN